MRITKFFWSLVVPDVGIEVHEAVFFVVVLVVQFVLFFVVHLLSLHSRVLPNFLLVSNDC